MDLSSNIFKVFLTTSLCFGSAFVGKLSFIFLSNPISFVSKLSIVAETSGSFVVKSHALFKSLINASSKIGCIAFLFVVNEFITSSLFNIFCLISLSLKFFCTF